MPNSANSDVRDEKTTATITGTLPFSNVEYSKLRYRVFPTLRREDTHGEVGDVNTITHGKKGSRDTLGNAEIIAKETITLNDERFNTSFFCFDTEADDWDEAYERLSEFYDEVIEPNEELVLYWNLWLNQM